MRKSLSAIEPKGALGEAAESHESPLFGLEQLICTNTHTARAWDHGGTRTPKQTMSKMSGHV